MRERGAQRPSGRQRPGELGACAHLGGTRHTGREAVAVASISSALTSLADPPRRIARAARPVLARQFVVARAASCPGGQAGC
jgi:hypothetical protein